MCIGRPSAISLQIANASRQRKLYSQNRKIEILIKTNELCIETYGQLLFVFEDLDCCCCQKSDSSDGPSQELSRNAFVVSIVLFYRNHSCRMCSGHDPKSSKFSKKCSLRASCSIWAALPGAQNLDGSSPPIGRGKNKQN